MSESMEYNSVKSNSYCIDCGRDIPTEFIPEQEETYLCFYCFRKHIPRY